MHHKRIQENQSSSTFTAVYRATSKSPARRAELFAGMRERAESRLPAPVQDRQDYRDGLVLAAAFRQETTDEVEDFGPEVSPLADSLIASIGAIVSGVPFGQLEQSCGLTNYELRLCAAFDKGYRKLYDWAGRERKRVRAERMEDLLAEKASEGIAKPVVVRKGRDNDEIEMVKVQSETLITRATELLARSQESAETGVPSHQTVYNIQLPDYLLKERKLAKPEKVVDAEVVG